MIKIYNASNVIEAERIESLLKDKGIRSYHQDSPSGVAAHNVPGFGLFGVDIYVDNQDAEFAAVLVESIKE